MEEYELQPTIDALKKLITIVGDVPLSEAVKWLEVKLYLAKQGAENGQESSVECP